MTKNPSKIFFLFLIVHLLTWTLIPSLTNNNLPLDTIEALAWGSNLDWGFNKHPPLSAFAVEVFYQIFGSQDWAFYFLSQVFVIIAFFAVYKLSLEILNNEKLALLSVLLLEGIYFYNFTTPEFNVNVAQLPFWALTVYYSWRCIKYDKVTDYVFLGLFAGLGILSKYLFVYLIIGIKLVFIYFLRKGKKIKFSHYFIAGPITLLILLPHLIWLTDNNYITITYGLQRTGGLGGFLDHLIYPLSFLGKQAGLLIPFLLMSFFLIKKMKSKINLKDEKLEFLLLTTIVPIFLMLLTSMIMGAKIRTMWMTPFYLFAGTLMIYIFKSQINLNKLKNFTTIFIVLFLISPFTYAYISITKNDKRTDFPGEQYAKQIQKVWDEKFNSKIIYVIGDEWWGGNLSYHLNSRPKWVPLSDREKAVQLLNYKKSLNAVEIGYSAHLIGDK
jgi:4-amino-4-deoxy-L-arabinose transferase-like glycosyltransferase